MTCSTSWAKADNVHPFMDHHSVPIFRWLLPAQSVSQSSDLLKLVCWRQKRGRPIMSKVSLILTCMLHVAIIHNVYYVAVVLCTGLPWQKRTALLILLKQHCWKNTVETTPSTTLFFFHLTDLNVTLMFLHTLHLLNEAACITHCLAYIMWLTELWRWFIVNTHSEEGLRPICLTLN